MTCQASIEVKHSEPLIILQQKKKAKVEPAEASLSPAAEAKELAESLKRKSRAKG